MDLRRRTKEVVKKNDKKVSMKEQTNAELDEAMDSTKSVNIVEDGTATDNTKVVKDNDKNDADNKDEKDVTGVAGPSGNQSPDPNCSICLGKLDNKSFTDSCFHMFCFTCLLEWSKVKAECPLCKQPFKSIIHNVRSYEDYDQYNVYEHTRPPANDANWIMDAMFDNTSRRFRYRTTFTFERLMDAHYREQQRQLWSLQLRPTSSVTTRMQVNRRRQAATSEFRRRVYLNHLKVARLDSGSSRRSSSRRVRNITPQFFKSNPASVHRLVPWLNRELNALLDNNENHVQFLLELILDLVKRFEIESEEFFQHIRPFIGLRTRHFVHEFVSFTRSPYDMVAYDLHAIYGPSAELVDSNSDQSAESPNSDVIILSPSQEPRIPPLERPARHRRRWSNVPDDGVGANVEVHLSPVLNTDVDPLLSRMENILQSNAARELGPSCSGWNSTTPSVFWPGTGFNCDQYANISTINTLDYLGLSAGASAHPCATATRQTISDSESDDNDVVITKVEKPWGDRSPIVVSSDSDTIDANMRSSVHPARRPRGVKLYNEYLLKRSFSRTSSRKCRSIDRESRDYERLSSSDDSQNSEQYSSKSKKRHRYDSQRRVSEERRKRRKTKRISSSSSSRDRSFHGHLRDRLRKHHNSNKHSKHRSNRIYRDSKESSPARRKHYKTSSSQSNHLKLTFSRNPYLSIGDARRKFKRSMKKQKHHKDRKSGRSRSKERDDSRKHKHKKTHKHHKMRKDEPDAGDSSHDTEISPLLSISNCSSSTISSSVSSGSSKVSTRVHISSSQEKETDNAANSPRNWSVVLPEYHSASATKVTDTILKSNVRHRNESVNSSNSSQTKHNSSTEDDYINRIGSPPNRNSSLNADVHNNRANLTNLPNFEHLLSTGSQNQTKDRDDSSSDTIIDVESIDEECSVLDEPCTSTSNDVIPSSCPSSLNTTEDSATSARVYKKHPSGHKKSSTNNLNVLQETSGENRTSGDEDDAKNMPKSPDLVAGSDSSDACESMPHLPQSDSVDETVNDSHTGEPPTSNSDVSLGDDRQHAEGVDEVNHSEARVESQHESDSLEPSNDGL